MKFPALSSLVSFRWPLASFFAVSLFVRAPGVVYARKTTFLRLPACEWCTQRFAASDLRRPDPPLPRYRGKRITVMSLLRRDSGFLETPARTDRLQRSVIERWICWDIAAYDSHFRGNFPEISSSHVREYLILRWFVKSVLLELRNSKTDVISMTAVRETLQIVQPTRTVQISYVHTKWDTRISD
jgi:hypothetical protein